MLYLVRHAMPAVDPGQDPATWVLSPAGRRAALTLLERLPADALLVASDEPKAWQTLDPTGDGRGVIKDGRLGEVRRREAFSDNFQVARLAYVNGEDHAGWESRQAVAARMQAAVEEHQAASEDRPLVVAGHGMSMTLWLSSMVGLSDPATSGHPCRCQTSLSSTEAAAGDMT